MTEGKFALGRIVATPAAKNIMDRTGVAPATLLARHHSGDWGDIDEEDQATNAQALEHGLRLFSAYGAGPDRLYVITEWDRSVTTILTPSDY